MKSSEFERLGDGQRKQQWAFEDAKEDAVTRKSTNTDYQRGGEAPAPSTYISTDRTTLKPRKKTK